jgi:EmrB/QacA subfamily drug resistance transporter
VTGLRFTGDAFSGSAHESASIFTRKKRFAALSVVGLAFVMNILDGTVLSVAIPTLQQDLQASYGAIQWIIASYALVFASLLITGGRLGDVFGYKKVFMFGVAGFTLASLLCGLALSPEMLIVARTLQGASAALMSPQVMSVVHLLFKDQPHERASISGIFGALAGIAGSIGPVIGGFLIQANIGGLGWRTVFLVNIPLGLLTLIYGARYIPQGKAPHPLKLDICGTFLVILLLGLFLFPLIQGREAGWPKWVFAMMLTALPVFAVLMWWQVHKTKQDASPLIELSLFRRRTFSVGLLLNVLFSAAMACFGLGFALFLQIGLAYDPLAAGFTTIFMSASTGMLMVVFGKKISQRLGVSSISIGAIVMIVGVLLTVCMAVRFGVRLSPWELAPSLILIGAGMGLVFGVLMRTILGDVELHHIGVASGLANATQQVGSAIGIAIVGVVLFGQLHVLPGIAIREFQPQLQHALTQHGVADRLQDKAVATFQDCLMQSTVSRGRSSGADCSPTRDPTSSIVTEYRRKAQAWVYARAFMWSGRLEVVILAGCLGLSLMLKKTKST